MNRLTLVNSHTGEQMLSTTSQTVPSEGDRIRVGRRVYVVLARTWYPDHDSWQLIVGGG